MADISIINKDNTNYNVKDAAGRLALAEVENKGAKNLFDIQHPSTVRSTSYSATSDGGVELTCSNAAWTQYIITDIPVESGCEYAFALYVDEISGTNTFRVYIRDNDSTGNVLFDSNNISTAKTINATITSDPGKIWVGIYINNSATAKTASAKIRAMICIKAEWDISHAYVPYGKTNAELTNDASTLFTENTRQETEIGVVANAGAKNLLRFDLESVKALNGGTWSGNANTINGVTTTVNDTDKTISFVKTASGGDVYFRLTTALKSILSSGSKYILSGATGGSSTTFYLGNSGNWENMNGDTEITYTGSFASIYVCVKSTMPLNTTITIKPMLRPAAITDPTFQPYAKTNRELTEENISQQSEIDYAVNAGVKNLLPMTHTNGSITRYGVTCAWDSNSGTMTLNGAHSSGDSAAIFEFYDGSAEDTKILPAGSYVLTGCPAGGSTSSYRAVLSQITGAVDIGNGVNFELSEPHYAAYRILISGNVTFNNMVFKPMIRPAAITDATFQPYARTNRELTVLTDEDRASLVELVDGGAKNLLKNTLGSGTKSGLSYTTGTDGSIVITAGTAMGGNADFVIPFTPKESGQYVLQGCPDGGSGTTYKGQIVLYPSMANVVEIYENTSATATLTGGTQYAYRFRVYNGKPISNSTIYPMVCSEAAWKISHAYKPYSPSWQEAYLSRGIQISTGDLDDYKSTGRYYISQASHAAAIAHSPTTTAGYTLNVEQGYQAPYGTIQTATVLDVDSSLIIYKRMYRMRSNVWGWSSWYKFEGTAMN